MAFNLRYFYLRIVDKKRIFYGQTVQGHCTSFEIIEINLSRVCKTLIKQG